MAEYETDGEIGLFLESTITYWVKLIGNFPIGDLLGDCSQKFLLCYFVASFLLELLFCRLTLGNVVFRIFVKDINDFSTVDLFESLLTF